MVGLRRLLMMSIVGLAFLMTGCQKEHKIRIGITQFVDHAALDRARQGFIDALADRDYEHGQNIIIDYQSAHGDFANTTLIAETFVSKRVDLIFAIATPSAQAARNVTEGTNIPVLFSAVTDPVGAGLVDRLDKPGGNVSGTSDMSPMDKQFALIRAVLGTQKRIGVLYHQGEQNSIVQVDAIRKEAGHDFAIEAVGIADSATLQLELEVLLRKVDALLIPTDNLMASNMELIAVKAIEAGIPVFGTEANQVEAGALMTEGIDYYDLGYQTGMMAADILEGKVEVSELAVQLSEVTELVINLDTAKALNLNIPQDLLDRATLIENGVMLNDD